jgi:hypothetical protein
MKGDFTRDTFNPAKHFTRVLMQQGRVQLDADFNEQTAILLHYLQTLAADVIGAFGGPEHHLGFGVLTNLAQLNHLTDEEKAQIQADTKIVEKVLSGMETNGRDFMLTKGRYYVGGVLCENHQYGLFSEQANYPKDVLQKLNPPFLFYLDVWERHITDVEDGEIKEVALGGADTATRAKVEWQIKVWPTNEDDRKNPPSDLTREEVLANWQKWLQALQPANHGWLKAKLKSTETSTDPCIINADARYRGAENQLYRVEIHQGGKAGQATFKWSRENGSVVFPIVDIADNQFRLANLGRDSRLGLKVNDWVEYVDEDVALKPEAAALLQVTAIEPIDFTVTLKPASGVNAPNYSKNAQYRLLRRWEQKGDGKKGGAVMISESDKDWIALEENIEIQFQSGGQYRTGDYWLIPARTATGNIEWPQVKDGGAKSKTEDDQSISPASLPPHGIKHHYAPLAIIAAAGTAGRLTEGDAIEVKKTSKKEKGIIATNAGQIADCRLQFKPLSQRDK